MADKMIAWGEPPSKMRVVPNPAEDAPADALGDGDYVLAVGRLSPEKGFDIAVRAAAALQDTEIRIAGSGSQDAALKRLAETSKASKAKFLGYADAKALSDLRRHARALIMPSVWYENAPLAALEAMAQGVPVIASRIGGLPELVEDGITGLLVPAGDAGELAAAITRIRRLPDDEWRRLSLAARDRMRERHSWDGHLEALDALYAEV